MDVLATLLLWGAIFLVVLYAMYCVVKKAVKDAWKELRDE